jgi:sulfofructose kinase
MFIDEDTIRLKKPKVLGIGEVVIDQVFLMDQMWEKGVTLQNVVAEKHIGGTVPAALVTLARLGVDCTFLTSLGRDEEAKIIRKQMKHEGIKILPKVQKRTKINGVIVHKATGFREKLKGDVVHVPIRNIDRKFLAEYDLIVIDRHERQAFYEVMEKKLRKTKVLIDTSTEVSDFTLDMMKLAEIPIVPIEVVVSLGLSGKLLDGLRKLHGVCQKKVIVTCGGIGSLVFNGKDMDFMPSVAVNVVDTLGAGDVFRGAFCYGILLNWDLKRCAEFANLVAGLQCTKVGNITAIPTQEEILQFERLRNMRKDLAEQGLDEYYQSLCKGIAL